MPAYLIRGVRRHFDAFSFIDIQSWVHDPLVSQVQARLRLGTGWSFEFYQKHQALLLQLHVFPGQGHEARLGQKEDLHLAGTSRAKQGGM